MERRKETFIVNLWIDSGVGAGVRRTECRGSVEHVPSHRRRYFSELVELVEFLAHYTQADGSNPS